MFLLLVHAAPRGARRGAAVGVLPARVHGPRRHAAREEAAAEVAEARGRGHVGAVGEVRVGNEVPAAPGALRRGRGPGEQRREERRRVHDLAPRRGLDAQHARAGRGRVHRVVAVDGVRRVARVVVVDVAAAPVVVRAQVERRRRRGDELVAGVRGLLHEVRDVGPEHERDRRVDAVAVVVVGVVPGHGPPPAWLSIRR